MDQPDISLYIFHNYFSWQLGNEPNSLQHQLNFTLPAKYLAQVTFYPSFFSSFLPLLFFNLVYVVETCSQFPFPNHCVRLQDLVSLQQLLGEFPMFSSSLLVGPDINGVRKCFRDGEVVEEGEEEGQEQDRARDVDEQLKKEGQEDERNQRLPEVGGRRCPAVHYLNTVLAGTGKSLQWRNTLKLW